MKRLILVASFLVLASFACRKSQHDSRLAPKGMELYSWHPAENRWAFSLLPGTNRRKLAPEITAQHQIIEGIDVLKTRLGELPKGEIVFWKNIAEEPIPGSISKELITFCREHGIRLTLEEAAPNRRAEPNGEPAPAFGGSPKTTLPAEAAGELVSP
jgi:hypothetical protein